MANKHVENLEKAAESMREARRALAAEIAEDGADADENDLADLADLQRNLEAIERAIDDEQRLYGSSLDLPERKYGPIAQDDQ